MNCNICFDNISNDESISCIDKKCSGILCIDCMKQYIESMDSLPTCVNMKCKKYYILSQVSKVSDKNIVEKYNQLCLRHFLNNNSDEIKNNIAKNELISKLREERNVFVKKSFPLAVQTVINFCMKDRLNKIDKSNKELVNTIVTSSGHFCMLSYCNGKLDVDFKCSKCETEFCQKCEKIKKESHTCKESDLLTMEFIATIGQCPNCKIPIEKSEGCRSMKCVNCDTCFDYYTGQEADHGGRNEKIIIKESMRLVDMYSQFYDSHVLSRLNEFERRIPSYKSENDKRIINTVGEFVAKGKEHIEVYAHKVALLFDEMNVKKCKYMLHMKKISEIEHLHESGNLNLKNLEQIIDE